MKPLALLLFFFLSFSSAEDKDQTSPKVSLQSDSSLQIQDYIRLTERVLESVKDLSEKNLALAKSHAKLEKLVSLLEMQVDGLEFRLSLR
jgi:hypothetical protein